MWEVSKTGKVFGVLEGNCTLRVSGEQFITALSPPVPGRFAGAAAPYVGIQVRDATSVVEEVEQFSTGQVTSGRVAGILA